MEESTKHKWKLATYFIIMLILALGITLFATYCHEEVHKRIFIYFGCTDIELYLFPNPRTTATCVLEENAMNTMHLANSINEAIGYTVMPWLVIIVGCLFINEFKKIMFDP
jgi:hypothetical protein